MGGFGESPYLKSQLDRLFGSQGIEIVTVEQPAYVLSRDAMRRLIVVPAKKPQRRSSSADGLDTDALL